MASAHVPLFLDGRLARPCRGAPCVDGSFPDFFTGANCDLLTYGGESVVFDYFFDPAIVRNGRMDMLQVGGWRGVVWAVGFGRRGGGPERGTVGQLVGVL
jgi:hypothetical protein